MKTFYLHSLGCDKNTVDSEKLAYALELAGFEQSVSPYASDFILVNTCGFIDKAKEESIEAIYEATKYKITGMTEAVIVLGCLSERYKREISVEIEGIDFVCGKDSIFEILRFMLGHDAPSFLDFNGRILSTPPFQAYLKISEGCSKGCTFCAIPSIVGPHRSADLNSLIQEAKSLAADGVKELILVAQDTGNYGSDLHNGVDLVTLIENLESIDGIHWIRLMYMYPESITPKLVSYMKNSKKLLPYLDIPYQHASDEILAAMGRHQTKGQILGQIEYLREEVPDICIRSTFICGFPGEKSRHFEELKDFMQNTMLDRVGVFMYSREEGTPASTMQGQVTPKTKESRYAELMSLQENLSYQKLEKRVGTWMEVLVEGDKIGGVYEARSYLDAPDVDGCVYITTKELLTPGCFYSVYIVEATEHDLFACLESDNDEHAK